MKANKYMMTRNYIETWLGKHDDDCFKTTLPQEQFEALLKVMKKYDAKCNQGDFKSYTCYDMVLVKKIVDHDAQDIKVYQQKVVDVTTTPYTQTLHMERKKVASVLFPSTCNIHRTTFFRKLVFRVNHRIFVNFVQEKEQGSDQTHFKVFVNFNSAKDIDVTEQMNIMNKVVNDLSRQLEGSTS